MSVKIGENLKLNNAICGICENYDADIHWCHYNDVERKPSDTICDEENFRFIGFTKLMNNGWVCGEFEIVAKDNKESEL